MRKLLTVMMLVVPFVVGIPAAQAENPDGLFATPLRGSHDTAAATATLSRREAVVEAAPSFLTRPSIRLAEITMLRVESRAVRLRFTLAGTPPPLLVAPSRHLRGQALLSVHVDLVSAIRQ